MLFKRRGKFLATIVIFPGVFATFEWQCVNVGMSMRWRGRLASMAMFSEVPLFASGDGAVMMPLSPSAICVVLFSRCLGGGRSAPYSSADGFVSARSDGFEWADLAGQGAGRCQMRWCASWTLCRRSLGPIHERVVSVLRSVLLRWSAAYRALYFESGIPLSVLYVDELTDAELSVRGRCRCRGRHGHWSAECPRSAPSPERRRKA